MNKNLLTKLKKNKKGFTLIELIVVIAILGILAALAIPRLTGAQARAKVSADKGTFATLNSAIAIALAEDRIDDGDFVVTITADTGAIAADDSDGNSLLESGAAFQLDDNAALGTLTWVIDEGAIDVAPTIDEDGLITDTP